MTTLEKCLVGVTVVALLLSVTTLIIVVTITNHRGDQLQTQLNSEDAKQSSTYIFAIEKFLNTTVKGINRDYFNQYPSPASGHILFVNSDVNGAPKFNNEPTMLNLMVESNYHGINVSKEGIKILYSGLYYVYSSINYKLTTVKCSELAYQEWFHYVLRLNVIEDTKTTLLRSVYTCCKECDHIEETKHTAGIFYLESGDLITAMCSGQNLMGGNKESSFLGLFMLNSGQRVDR